MYDRRVDPFPFRPHPWHGIDPGPHFPEIVVAYIEITPTDGIKYEIDKHSGYLKVDRPQRFSNFCPTLYGFVPRTYCGEEVARHVIKGSPETDRGDGDPLDICVISERPITHSEILVPARVVGGLRLIDRGEADDKIIAVLDGDYVWGKAQELDDIPPVLVERLEHYFSTYKLVPGEPPSIHVAGRFGFDDAAAVIAASLEDYAAEFPEGAGVTVIR